MSLTQENSSGYWHGMVVGRPKGYKCTYPLGNDVPVILTKIRKQPKMHNMRDIDMKYREENGKHVPFVRAR